MLVKAEYRKRHEGYKPVPLSSLSVRMVADASRAIETREPIQLSYPIRNVDRSVGARLSGDIAARYGDEGLPEGTIDVLLSGTAGQSFGAWLSRGVSLRLQGTANDYVGKGMGGGMISVTPRRSGSIPHAAGNAVLYGATGGRVFLGGRVGQRFAVRNSGASAVVEGCSDHGCEYMTGGMVVVIGDVGRNFAAGMTGGAAYVWDPDLKLKGRLAETAPEIRRPVDAEIGALFDMLEQHGDHTSSPLAIELLADPARLAEEFWLVAPGSHRANPVQRVSLDVEVSG